MYFIVQIGGFIFFIWLMQELIKTNVRRAVEKKEREMIISHAKELYEKYRVLPDGKALAAMIHKDLFGE